MEITWTTEHCVWFGESFLDEIVNYFKWNPWDDTKAIQMIDDVVFGFNDDTLYAWNTEQTMKVLQEIKRRLS